MTDEQQRQRERRQRAAAGDSVQGAAQDRQGGAPTGTAREARQEVEEKPRGLEERPQTQEEEGVPGAALKGVVALVPLMQQRVTALPAGQGCHI